MAPLDTSPDPSATPSDGTRMAIKIAVVEIVASWLVRRAMDVMTGRACEQCVSDPSCSAR